MAWLVASLVTVRTLGSGFRGSALAQVSHFVLAHEKRQKETEYVSAWQVVIMTLIPLVESTPLITALTAFPSALTRLVVRTTSMLWSCCWIMEQVSMLRSQTAGQLLSVLFCNYYKVVVLKWLVFVAGLLPAYHHNLLMILYCMLAIVSMEY